MLKHITLSFLIAQASMHAADTKKIRVEAYKINADGTLNPACWGISKLPIYSQSITIDENTTYGKVIDNIEKATNRRVKLIVLKNMQDGTLISRGMGKILYEFKLSEEPSYMVNLPIYAMCSFVPQCGKQEKI
jgi:hypothetical protein